MAEGPETQPENSSSSQPSSGDLSQVPFDGLKAPMSPVMYPAPAGLFPPQPGQDQANRGPGLYAVRVLPSVQAGPGFQTNTLLIPFNYNIPTAHSSSGIGELNGEQGQAGEQLAPQQEARPQRLVRRFQIIIQLDLLLILKLAAVVFLFHDGSKLRLALLVVLASFVYLHQTGALAPVIRWLSQRAAAVRAANLPAAEPQGNENIGLLAAEAQAVGVNENEQANDGNIGEENGHAVEQPGQGEARNRLWGIVKEIQIFVFGFITSLLPAFNNAD